MLLMEDHYLQFQTRQQSPCQVTKNHYNYLLHYLMNNFQKYNKTMPIVIQCGLMAETHKYKNQ